MSEQGFAFSGGRTGEWHVTSIIRLMGQTLPDCDYVSVKPISATNLAAVNSAPEESTKWSLAGWVKPPAYTTDSELDQLSAIQEAPGRQTDTRAVLIAIKKSDDWWELSQEERRKMIEPVSKHITIGMDYLPAISRRLHHSREISGQFYDFIAWFEFAPEDETAFDDLLMNLRETEEWSYITEEVELRLHKVK